MRTLYFLGLPFLWCKGVKRNLGEFVNGGFSLCCPAYGRSDFSACYSFLILILYYFPDNHYFRCVFPQVWCVLVQAEPSCDQTEFLHPNGSCVSCPVCGPGEQLSEVTHIYCASAILSLHFHFSAFWLQVYIFHHPQDCGFGDGGEGVCMVCKEGRFSTDTDVAPCKRCTQCNLLNRMEKITCSSTSDALCGQCLSR